MAVALAFAIGLFFVLPVLAATAAEALSGSACLAHVVEAVVRLGLLVGYVSLIGLLPEIRRVYAYHGAEHMTIHAYEAGDPLVPDRIKRFSPAHPRCGTAFLMLVVIISVFVFVLVGTAGPDHPHSLQDRTDPGDRRTGLRGLALGGAHFGHPLVRLFVAPGLALQALTTRYPDDSQIEVAVAAFEEAAPARKHWHR